MNERNILVIAFSSLEDFFDPISARLKDHSTVVPCLVQTDQDAWLEEIIKAVAAERCHGTFSDCAALVDRRIFPYKGEAVFARLASLARDLHREEAVLVLVSHDVAADHRAATQAGARLVVPENFVADVFVDQLAAITNHDKERDRLRKKARRFAGVGFFGGLLTAVIGIVVPAITQNWFPCWSAILVPGIVSPERTQYLLFVSNDGVAPLSGVQVAELPEGTICEDLAVGLPLNLIEAGKTAIHRFSIVHGKVGNTTTRHRLWIKLKGPGRELPSEYLKVQVAADSSVRSE